MSHTEITQPARASEHKSRSRKLILGLTAATAAVAVAVLLNRGSEPQMTAEQLAQREKFLAEATMMMPPFAPLQGAPTASAAEADAALNPEELVIGLEVSGKARAYPVNMINDADRKVLNDSVGDTPVLVTWCDLCHTAAVFLRSQEEVAGGELFAVSGLLWNDSLVIYDLQTQSFWNQIAGRCLAGPRQGESLTPVSSTLSTWSEWKARHPETDVLAASHVSQYTLSSYLNEGDGIRRFGYAFWAPYDGTAYAFDYLQKNQLVQSGINGRGVLIVTHPKNFAVRAYSSEVDGQTLTFANTTAGLQDAESGTVWDPATGRGLSGKHSGQHLKPIPGYTALLKSWRNLNPGGQIIIRDQSTSQRPRT